MREKEKRSEEDRRKNTMRRSGFERRQSQILHHELLKLDIQDKRSGTDRRRGIEERAKSTYILE